MGGVQGWIIASEQGRRHQCRCQPWLLHRAHPSRWFPEGDLPFFTFFLTLISPSFPFLGNSHSKTGPRVTVLWVHTWSYFPQSNMQRTWITGVPAVVSNMAQNTTFHQYTLLSWITSSNAPHLYCHFSPKDPPLLSSIVPLCLWPFFQWGPWQFLRLLSDLLGGD